MLRKGAGHFKEAPWFGWADKAAASHLAPLPCPSPAEHPPCPPALPSPHWVLILFFGGSPIGTRQSLVQKLLTSPCPGVMLTLRRRERCFSPPWLLSAGELCSWWSVNHTQPPCAYLLAEWWGGHGWWQLRVTLRPSLSPAHVSPWLWVGAQSSVSNRTWISLLVLETLWLLGFF